ncbi:MAG: hypothetical protein KGL39_44465 [Patescibacteria group bacterium]|nr:hypothetical protein [Patescibacteria group bacterium]
MNATEQTKSKTRLIEVTMRFWKVFHVEVPEGVTEEDVLESELVQDESRSWGCDVDVEHDETSTKDEGHKTPEEIERLKRHEKVFTWDEAQNA